MRDRWLYAGIALAAVVAGSTFRMLDRPNLPPGPTAPTIGAAAIYAASFIDEEGHPQSLGRFQGRVVVINFWATWCPPCREEMPTLSAAAREWAGRDVAFVGLSSESPESVGAYRHANAVSYPLWTGAATDDLSRRLGDTAGVLPYSVVLDGAGRVIDQRVGPYSPAALHEVLARSSAKAG